MGTSVDVEVHLAIPFDHDIFVESDVLGLAIQIEVAGNKATLQFPRKDPSRRSLLRPLSAAGQIERYLPDGVWGIRDGAGQIEIRSALVCVPARTVLDFDLAMDQAGGEGLQTILQDVAEWWDSFCYWLWLLTVQALNPTDPDPKVVHRRSLNIVTMVKQGMKYSIPASGSPPMVVTVSTKGVSAEHKVNAALVRKAALEAGATPPLFLELFASARMAARRGDHRRSLIDVGSVCESVLSSLLGLSPGHKLTLGSLVTSAIKKGLELPQDIRIALVDPRNDAVHRGVVAPGTDVNRALEIAEELVLLIEPKHISTKSLKAFNRPQRQDLMLIVPKRRQTD